MKMKTKIYLAYQSYLTEPLLIKELELEFVPQLEMTLVGIPVTRTHKDGNSTHWSDMYKVKKVEFHVITNEMEVFIG